MDRRGRRGRGRGRGRGAARRKKSVEPKDDIELEESTPIETTPAVESFETPSNIKTIQTLDMDADISQLEAPTFTTLSRGPPEPMLRLRWGHPLNLIGEKVLNPLIYCCDTCLRPILIYGRMIPCRHVFCLSCAQRDSSQCGRCGEKGRAEQAGLGSVFMCTFGGSRYGNTGCRRTYLSERDLQAHINHRHMPGQPQQNPQTFSPSQINKTKPETVPTAPPPRPTYPLAEPVRHRNPQYYDTPPPPMKPNPPPPVYYEKPNEVIMGVGPPRTGNLITVPIQEPSNQYYPTQYVGPPPTAYYPAPPFEYPPPPPADTSIPPPWPPQNPPFYG